MVSCLHCHCLSRPNATAVYVRQSLMSAAAETAILAALFLTIFAVCVETVLLVDNVHVELNRWSASNVRIVKVHDHGVKHVEIQSFKSCRVLVRNGIDNLQQ